MTDHERSYELVLPTKICTGCAEAKPLSGFHRNKRSPDGFQWRCKECHTAAVKAAQERRRARDPEGFLEARRQAVAKVRATNPRTQANQKAQREAYQAATAMLKANHRAESTACICWNATPVGSERSQSC